MLKVGDKIKDITQRDKVLKVTKVILRNPNENSILDWYELEDGSRLSAYGFEQGYFMKVNN